MGESVRMDDDAWCQHPWEHETQRRIFIPVSAICTRMDYHRRLPADRIAGAVEDLASCTYTSIAGATARGWSGGGAERRIPYVVTGTAGAADRAL